MIDIDWLWEAGRARTMENDQRRVPRFCEVPVERNMRDRITWIQEEVKIWYVKCTQGFSAESLSETRRC